MRNSSDHPMHPDDPPRGASVEKPRADIPFELAAAALAELSPETGRFLRVNGAMSALTGYSPEELCGLTISGLVTGGRKRSLGARFPWDGKRGAGTDTVRLRRKDGTTRDVELRFSGYGDPAGTVVVTAFDVSGRIALEQENRTLHGRIEAVLRLKNDFLSHVSHELRTPIGGIMGMTEVLLHRIQEDELRQFLAVIRESSRSLLYIVEDILDLANIENGKLELRTMEFDLQQELERTVGLFTDRAAEKHLKIALRLSMDLPKRVFGDPKRLSQILRNLIENAVEYTENGEVTVTGKRSGDEDGLTTLMFAVEDTGPGIPPEDELLLFTEFGSLRDVYTRRSKEGTGLGLAISRKLVEMMGGDIRYRRQNPGSVISFTITLKTAYAETPRNADGSERVSNSLSALPPLRILMAEDNLINRLFLGMMLKDAGHTIVEVENGALAVESVKKAFEHGNPFDLVLMDVQMPEMNGMEATKLIRAMKGAASLVPIIAITAFAMKTDEEKFIEAGMDGYVTKPVDFEELADTIMRLTESDYLDLE